MSDFMVVAPRRSVGAVLMLRSGAPARTVCAAQIRPIGGSLMMSFLASGPLAKMAAITGGSIIPGRTALMQIRLEAYSTAALLEV